MELAKEIFGKELFQINFEDLEEYFKVPREETSLLEFKSGEVKINSIFKEICAFLNTEGGVIVVGSPKEKKIHKTGCTMKRICQGKLVPSGFRSKRWINSLVATNIVPSPEGLSIHEILSEEGNYFIIEVPQSKNPPHQFLTDGRYYIRVDKEARPAPHGIVESLFYKKKRAQLNVQMEIDRDGSGAETFNEVYVQIMNTSQFPAEGVSYLVQVFNIEEIQQDGTPLEMKSDNKSHSIEFRGSSDDVLVDDRTLSIHFRVMNKLQPFLISILAWNREAGMFKNYSIFDPMNFRYVETYRSGDTKDKTLSEMTQSLNELTDQLG